MSDNSLIALDSIIEKALISYIILNLTVSITLILFYKIVALIFYAFTTIKEMGWWEFRWFKTLFSLMYICLALDTLP